MVEIFLSLRQTSAQVKAVQMLSSYWTILLESTSLTTDMGHINLTFIALLSIYTPYVFGKLLQSL
jgi:hypothetical protein